MAGTLIKKVNLGCAQPGVPPLSLPATWADPLMRLIQAIIGQPADEREASPDPLPTTFGEVRLRAADPRPTTLMRGIQQAAEAGMPVDAASDLVTRVALFDRTLAASSGGRGGHFASPLSVHDLAWVLHTPVGPGANVQEDGRGGG